jgi:hypothetical protein
MLDALRSLDRRTAAGVLAQTALNLEGRGILGDEPLVENQRDLEQRVLDQLRLELHLHPEDCSENAVAMLAEAIDQKTDDLAGTTTPEITEKLSAEGRLPSDIYEVDVNPQLAINYGERWAIESALTTETIRRPHQEQIVGGDLTRPEIPAVTILARFFSHTFPAKSFWFLVLAERVKLRLRVVQVIRVYPIEVDLSECETLIDVVKAFSKKFGHVIEIDGQRETFFFRGSATEADEARRKFSFMGPPGQHQTYVVTWFNSPDTGQVYLILPIRFSAYLKSVENWRGWDRNILQDIGLAG